MTLIVEALVIPFSVTAYFQLRDEPFRLEPIERVKESPPCGTQAAARRGGRLFHARNRPARRF
jgi:hypothetical protein